jgi:hypothetical protein
MWSVSQIAAVLGLLALPAAGAAGQTAAGGTVPTKPVPARTRVFSMVPAKMIEFAVLDAPYSCDLIIETTSTTSDGTTFSSERTLRREYRDSQGRLRVELPVFPGHGIQLITIWDLVAGYEYVLDSQHLVAHRSPLRATAAKPPQEIYATRRALPLRESTTAQGLGSQTIDGVYTEGWRFATTIPAGAEGNDRPFVVSVDAWVAPDMALRILEERSDPRSGHQVVRRNNFVRGEQPPSLFQVPADYSIVDEDGPYKVIFVRPGHN